MATAKKLPSGSWRCLVFSHYEDLFNEDGSPMIDEKTGKQKQKRIYESFTSDLQGRRGKRDAEAQAAQFLAEKDRKKRPENWTVKEAFENYIKLKDHVLSETTLRGYETIARNQIGQIADISLRKLSQEDVQSWINILSVKLSPKTVKNAYGLFTAVMRMYLPDMHFHTTLPSAKAYEGYVPSDQDITDLICYIRGSELEKAVLLAAFGSLRRGEVFGLTKEDIKGNSIRIRETKVRGRSGIIKKGPKTQSSYRYIIMPEFVIRKFDDIESGPLVRMHPEALSKNFKKVLRSAGIPEFRYHDLRHYTASIMHALNIPDQYIMKRGGWKSDRVLKRVYRGTIAPEEERFTDRINEHFTEMMQHAMQHDKRKAL